MPEMTQTVLKDDLKASLQDAATVFTAAGDADFLRFLDKAAADLARFRPRIEQDSVSLVADQTDYAAPAALVRIRTILWGRDEQRLRMPWEDNYPTIPEVSIFRNYTGKQLRLTPAPTAAQITDLGEIFPFLCNKYHVLSDEAAGGAGATTVAEDDRSLLLLRAQAEAMKEMAMRNITKPVQLQDNIGGITKNGTPAALHEQLLDEFERLAR